MKLFKDFLMNQIDKYINNLGFYNTYESVSVSTYECKNKEDITTYTQIFSDNERIVEISNYDTDQYWIKAYRQEVSNTGSIKSIPVSLTYNELYVFYHKLKAMNGNYSCLFKFFNSKSIEKEIKNLGYFNTVSKPNHLSYNKHDMDGNIFINVSLYKTGNLFLFYPRNVNDNPIEMNEKELFVFYHKMKEFIKEYKKNQEIMDRLINDRRFE